MKRIILFLVGGVLVLGYCVNAQTIIENRGYSLREIADDVQFEIGKANQKIDFTDKKTFYGHCNLNWRSEYQAELAYKLNDSTIQTIALKMSYVDTLFHKIIDLPKTNQKLELCQEHGNLYIFRYDAAAEKERLQRKKMVKSDKKRKEHIEQELRRFSGCKIEPLISQDWGDRILVGRYYYDFHHFMWRKDATNDDFIIAQGPHDVVETKNLTAESESIAGVLRAITANEWDRVKVETDYVNYAYVFTAYEGRMAIVIYYTFKGKMVKIRLLPRPKAEFENIKFTAETSKDVHEMSCEKGVVRIKIKPELKGTTLNKKAKKAIEWKINFGSKPGTDEAVRVGEIHL